MTESGPPERLARLVLVAPDGALAGSLAPVPVATPWWQDIGPVVAAIRAHHGLEVTVLRLLEADRDGPPGGTVTYLAEVAGPVPAAEPWNGALADHPLRLDYARPGGPAADLAWAKDVLAAQGLALSGPPQQVRTWNLSSLWRLPLATGDAWLKAVPPFFAHEGAMLELLRDEAVPRLIGHEGSRIVLAAVPGHDLYDAPLALLLEMVTLLVPLQHRFIGSLDRLLSRGLPDWRAAPLTAAIADTFERNREHLEAAEVAVLERFVAGLPSRFSAIAACGIPDTLVHGDFHPGNLRGGSAPLTLLDWGDSGIGHPLLDQAAFLERIAPDDVDVVREHWHRQWEALLPAADPARAARLLRPVAAARQAVIYQKFLDNIEPAEHSYHWNDPADWLRTTAGLVD